MIRYKPRRPADTVLRARLRELANERNALATGGCSFCCGKLASPRASVASTGFIARKASRCANAEHGGALLARAPIVVEAKANARWSLDFVRMSGGDPGHNDIRTALGAGTHRANCSQGQAWIVSDNGTEFTPNAMFAWQKEQNVAWHFIAPGKPMQNGFCERFMAACGTSSERAPLIRPHSCPRAHRHLDRRLQPAAALFGAGLRHATPAAYAANRKAIGCAT